MVLRWSGLSQSRNSGDNSGFTRAVPGSRCSEASLGFRKCRLPRPQTEHTPRGTAPSGLVQTAADSPAGSSLDLRSGTWRAGFFNCMSGTLICDEWVLNDRGGRACPAVAGSGAARFPQLLFALRVMWNKAGFAFAKRIIVESHQSLWRSAAGGGNCRLAKHPINPCKHSGEYARDQRETQSSGSR
jgi:hypothetical protein